MFNIMDEMSELIYVVDLESHELLYMNRAGKELFGVQNLTGKKCYQVIQGKEEPCEFCTTPLLVEGSFYTWEHRNPVVNRHYILKDHLIEWEGKKARIEIAFDMTEKENQKRLLQTALGIETVVTECARRLCSVGAGEESLDDVLGIIGTYLEAERVHIFEIQDRYMNNTYEWCADGVEPQKDNLQNKALVAIELWEEVFKNHECVVIENAEVLKNTHPDEYKRLLGQNIYSLIAVPLIQENQLIGYMDVDNPLIPMIDSTKALLTSIGYFIGAALCHRRTLRTLEHMGYFDALTGLINRNGYMRDIGLTTRYPLGVIYIDVNGMKQLNDQFGHQYGDRILVATAKIMRKNFSREQCYRVGGDEFVVICQGIGKEKFLNLVQSLKNMYSREKEYTVSIGSNWSDKDKIQDVLFTADELMYSDKQIFYRGKALSGRYRHQVDDLLGMTEPGILSSMLEENRFIVYYQPKFSMQTMKMSGMEALVRLKTLEGDLYSPDQFIPILEESRLISQLDFYVFERVCAQIREWMTQGVSVVPVATNFSGYTLAVADFAERLQNIRRKYGIPLELLEIEVTETVEADDKQAFYDVISHLGERHFQISIDDFGIKNVNLSLFTDVDFDILKIDKHVTENLCRNEKSRMLLSSLADICRSMNVRMIVEGVETQEQFDFLKESGCDAVQGFLFGKPIPPRQFQSHFLK